MNIGARVHYPEQVGLWSAEVIQISVYYGMEDSMELMRKCAMKCMDNGIPYVIHPVGFSLLDGEMWKDFLDMAENADLGLILHDERTPDGKRLDGQYEGEFLDRVDELRKTTSLSFENATDTGDIRWFWDRYADSVTIDLGHLESSGIDSVQFIRSLDEATIKKVRYVHVHHNDGLHGGLTDHWGLTQDCRELAALSELMGRTSGFTAILEISEDEMEKNLKLLRELRHAHGQEAFLVRTGPGRGC